MPAQKTWTLNVTPPNAPAVTLTDVPHEDMYAILRAMMAGESAEHAAAALADVQPAAA